MFKQLNSLDHSLSSILHNKDSLPLTAILYPLAAFFHPGLIWIAYLLVYYFSIYSIRFTAVYALGTLICVIATTILKKIIKRYHIS